MNGNALKGAFDAKIGKVPVVAVGVPIVIIGVIASRMMGKKKAATTAADAAATDTSQPTFFAKSVPDTWAAIDPSTGIGHSPDGTIDYIPTTGTDPTTPGTTTGTPPPTTPPAVPPSHPGSLSPHQAHLAHVAHVRHQATQGSRQDTPAHALSPHEAHVKHVAHVAHTKK